MKDVVPRIKPVVPYDTDDGRFVDRREEMKDTRNAYVHEQVDVAIKERDNEFLRQISYEHIPFFVINRNTGIARRKTWLENGHKPTDLLEHETENTVEELAVFRTIRESRLLFH